MSSSPILSDRSRFQLFWRTYPSDNSLTPAVLAVLRQYDWNQLKIITQEETLFVEVCACTSFMFRSMYMSHIVQCCLQLLSSKLGRNHQIADHVHIHVHIHVYLKLKQNGMLKSVVVAHPC